MPREKDKPNRKIIGIRYLSTWHRCECQCGEIFFVHVGDVFLVQTDDITNIAVRCPVCKWEAFLWHNNENPDLVPSGFITASPGERMCDKTNIAALEQTAMFHRRQNIVVENYLVSLQNACRQLLTKYHRMGGTFIEKELKNLKKIVKETEDSLEWHIPSDAK